MLGVKSGGDQDGELATLANGLPGSTVQGPNPVSHVCKVVRRQGVPLASRGEGKTCYVMGRKPTQHV
jgi:hypothetical protein